MKARVWLEKFDPGAEYEVNKPDFKFGGRNFAIGELFDVKTSERQLRILYDNRQIRVRSVEHEPSPVVEDPPPMADEPVSEVEDDSGSVETSTDPDVTDEVEKPEIVTKAGGWYDVVLDGKTLNEKSLRIEEAKKLAEEASHGVDLRREPSG